MSRLLKLHMQKAENIVYAYYSYNIRVSKKKNQHLFHLSVFHLQAAKN